MNMIDNQVIDNQCDYCKRKFLRNNTLFKHMCEPKRRFMDKDKPSNRIGYSAWRNYYETHHKNKKNLDYSDFINNNYYLAFVKFGIYCTDIGVINPIAFSIWLIKNKISIDNWTSDKSYTKYLIEYLRVEDVYDAIERSMKNLLQISQEQNIHISDVFKFCNQNKLCHMITTGKISPWVLFHSASGVNFLTNLSMDQSRLIIDYVDPEKWNIKFLKLSDQVREAKSILKKVPL